MERWHPLPLQMGSSRGQVGVKGTQRDNCNLLDPCWFNGWLGAVTSARGGERVGGQAGGGGELEAPCYVTDKQPLPLAACRYLHSWLPTHSLKHSHTHTFAFNSSAMVLHIRNGSPRSHADITNMMCTAGLLNGRMAICATALFNLLNLLLPYIL